MAQKIVELMQKHATSCPELAERFGLDQISEEMQEFPEMPDGWTRQDGEDSGIFSWGFGDPMLPMFKFRLASQLPKLGKQVGTAKQSSWTWQLTVLSFMAAGVAIAAKVLELPAWQSFLLLWLIFTSFQLMQLLEVGTELKVWLQLSWKLNDHMSFLHSCSGGNIVKLLMQLFDKLSYVELRLMYLVSSSREVARQLRQVFDDISPLDCMEGAVLRVAQEFFEARRRFKDMAGDKIEKVWVQIFDSTIVDALEFHEQSYNQELVKEDGSTKMIQELMKHVENLHKLKKMTFECIFS
jgi:hypothetical protein